MSGPLDRWRDRAGAVRGRLSGAREAFRRWRSSPGSLRMAGLVPGFVIAFGLVSAVLAIQVTSTPNFCGTCHIMRPYYQTWSQSKHHNVPCVECHISPGVGAELRKKVEALNMVVKYLTAAWGTNPWAQVDDAACLRCHERRLLEGKAPYGVARFDHEPHLGEAYEGLKLRCTSCHQHTIKSEHISVSGGTCALCHVRGQLVNPGKTPCTTCHEPPDGLVKTQAGTRFDHRFVSRQGLDCMLCHGRVTRGSGEVPPERCLTCHNDPKDLARYGEREALHESHTVEHKVACGDCHLQVQHGREALRSAPHDDRGACGSCHGAGHNAQQDLYAGIGARGVPNMPGPMYTTGVTCGGCHNRDVAPPQATTMFASHSPVIQRANEVSCMLCHGPGYDGVLAGWKAGMDERVGAMVRQMEATAPAMRDVKSSSWDDAVHNVRLVADGHGVHNVNYAYAVLDKAHEQMNAARSAVGLGALPRPWKEVAAGAKACVSCHTGIERRAANWRGHAFSHGPHVVDAKLDCAECHRPHNQRPASEVVRFGEQGCLGCHHTKAPRSAGDCQPCHARPGEQVVGSILGPFSHGAHRKVGLECVECHTMRNGDPRTDRGTCRSCHEQI